MNFLNKKDYAIGGVWKEAPKQPKNYRNLSIRKDVAENMLSYIKASIDKELPVVVGVSIGEKAEDKNGRMINEGVTKHFLVLTSYDVKDGKVVGFSGIDNSDHEPPIVDFKVNEKTGAIEKAKPPKITAENREYVDSYKYTVTQVRLWKGVEGLKPESSKGVW